MFINVDTESCYFNFFFPLHHRWSDVSCGGSGFIWRGRTERSNCTSKWRAAIAAFSFVRVFYRYSHFLFWFYNNSCSTAYYLLAENVGMIFLVSLQWWYPVVAILWVLDIGVIYSELFSWPITGMGFSHCNIKKKKTLRQSTYWGSLQTVAYSRFDYHSILSCTKCTNDCITRT